MDTQRAKFFKVQETEGMAAVRQVSLSSVVSPELSTRSKGGSRSMILSQKEGFFKKLDQIQQI